MLTCPSCGESSRDDSRRCISCGRSLLNIISPSAGIQNSPTASQSGKTFDYTRLHKETTSLLRRYGNKEKVVNAHIANGVAEGIAAEITTTVMNEIRAHNRRLAYNRMIGGAVVLVVFGAIFIFTGVLFYIILPLAALGLIWGFIGLFITTGWSMDVEDDDD